MNHTPVDDDSERSRVVTFPRTFIKSFGKPRLASIRNGVAERVAISMITRHGADAAREATVHLNRMIDRGDLAARDLWACVVHVIHERQEYTRDRA
jgi:hypothetical protein